MTGVQTCALPICNRRVASGRQHEHGVERLGDQVSPVGKTARRGEEPARVIERFGRQVAERRDLEAVVQLGQVVEVHHLGDEPAADHTNA